MINQTIGGQVIDGDILADVIEYERSSESPWTITVTYSREGIVQGIVVETYADDTFMVLTRRERTQ